MARHIVDFGLITIASGQTVSNVLTSRLGFGYAIDFLIWGPDTLPETVTLEVAPTETPAAADWAPLLRSDGTTVVTMTADRAMPVTSAAFKALRLVAGVAVAAQRDFRMLAQVDMAT